MSVSLHSSGISADENIPGIAEDLRVRRQLDFVGDSSLSNPDASGGMPFSSSRTVQDDPFERFFTQEKDTSKT